MSSTSKPKAKKVKAYDIPAAADFLGYTEQYVRTLVRNSEIKSVMVPIAPGAQVKKHIITEEELKRWQKSRSRKARRPDGRTKWLTYATFDEMRELMTLMEENDLQGVADLTRPANKLKNLPEWLEKRYD